MSGMTDLDRLGCVLPVSSFFLTWIPDYNVGNDRAGRVLRVWVDCDTVDGVLFGVLIGLGVC